MKLKGFCQFIMFYAPIHFVSVFCAFLDIVVIFMLCAVYFHNNICYSILGFLNRLVASL